jgi:hypothetical protein
MATSSQYGAQIPSTNVWDIPELTQINDQPTRELFIRLYQNINRISLAINVQDTGMYNTDQFVNGQLYFPNPNSSSANTNATQFRQVSRKVINFGALPNATTKSVPHGIICNASTTFTRIYGCSSDTTGFNYIPLPYASPVLVNNIELKVDATNVTVITGINRTNFNITYIILEFLSS